MQDADSVRRQQQAHQQHSCTLDECFQFYTKEEQVPPWGSAPLLDGGCQGPSVGGLTVLAASLPAGPGRRMALPPLPGPAAGRGEAEPLDPA